MPRELVSELKDRELPNRDTIISGNLNPLGLHLAAYIAVILRANR